MSIEPRTRERDVAPAEHGGPDHAELRRLGLRPEEVIDFSSNINAYGPSPAVREAVARTPLDRYPDNEALRLRNALAEHLGVSPLCTLPANGATELIWLACLTFLRPLDRVLVLGPTFAEFERMAMLMGARVKVPIAKHENNFLLTYSAIRDALELWLPRLVFLCNPNNPTGTVLDPQAIANWTIDYPHTLFIVDESYLAFASGLSSAMDVKRDNLLVPRSMTKDHALAGLRLGYAVAAQELIASLSRVRPPWSVNTLAQAAGIAALRDREHLARCLKLLAAAKDHLMVDLAELGLQVLPSAVCFFLVRVGDAAAVRRALLHKGILVRDCASFGLPEFVRICTRRPEENGQLVAAFREVGHGS